MPENERTMLGEAAPKSIQALIAALEAERSFVVGDGECARLETVVDHDMRVKAAEKILDRLYGKSAQAITGEDGGPIQVSTVDLTTLSDVQFAAVVALRDALKAGK